MTLRNLTIATIICAALASCSSNSDKSENRQNVPAKELNTGAVAEHTGDTKITPDENIPVVIDFNAPWCGPCRRFAPIFDEVAKEYEGKAIFLSVNVDNSPKTASQFEVSSIPQISILMPDGTITSTVGFMEKNQFRAFLSQKIK